MNHSPIFLDTWWIPVIELWSAMGSAIMPPAVLHFNVVDQYLELDKVSGQSNFHCLSVKFVC